MRSNIERSSRRLEYAFRERRGLEARSIGGFTPGDNLGAIVSLYATPVANGKSTGIVYNKLTDEDLGIIHDHLKTRKPINHTVLKFLKTPRGQTEFPKISLDPGIDSGLDNAVTWSSLLENWRGGPG